MLDLSWGEIMLIGAIALIVIGPKDLPRTLRAVGQAVGKVRRMAGEFQGHFNQAMREAELDEVRKEVEGMNRIASSALDPAKAVRNELKDSITGKAAANKPASKPAAADTKPAAAETKPAAAETKPAAAAAPEPAAKADAPAPEPAPAPSAPSPAPEPEKAPVAAVAAKDEAKP